MATSTIKPKRGTTAQWARSERILEWNEWGVEETVSGDWILRVGDGEHEFLDLPKVIDTPSLNELVAEAQNTYRLFFEGAEAKEVRFEELSSEITQKHSQAISDIETKGAETLATIPEDYTETYNRAVKNSRDIEFVTSTTTRNDKRLTNIEKSLSDDKFSIDSSVAYTKDVPEDALPYAEVTEIGGMTRKSTNIFGGEALANKLVEVAGATKDETAGTVTFSAAEVSNKILLDGCFKENTQYTFIFYGRNTNAETVKTNLGIYYSDGTIEVVYTPSFAQGGADSYIVYVSSVSNGRSVVRLCGMNDGDSTVLYYDKCGVFEGVLTEADFEPYFEGLRSAPVTEVESVGVNLLPIKDKVITSRGFTFTPKSDGSYVLNGTRTSEGSATNYLSFPKQLAAGTYALSLNNNETVGDDTLPGSVRIWFLLSNRNYVGACTAHLVNRTASVKCEAPIEALIIRIGENIQSLDNFVIRPQVERGNTASEFKPYVRNTLEIPEAVQNLDGYGWSVNDEVYNYVDWEKKQFVKRVERFVYSNGAVETRGSGDKRYFYFNIGTHGIGVDGVVLCNKFPTANVTSDTTEVGINVFNSTSGTSTFRAGVRPKNVNEWTAESFKAQLTEWYDSDDPLCLYYELAEPVITDISDILPDDNYIGVEGGGTVTMVNEHGFNVPSEVVYQLDTESEAAV